MHSDEELMRHAVALARNGAGWTNPNPLVGAVVVKDGRIIGEGWHERYGQQHAERNALDRCEQNPAGATMYVTLEPCCHQGKQPPCTEALVNAGISRVVVGSRDPNPLVSGKGNAVLREAGIVVTEDVLRNDCDALNPIFFHYIQKKRPYVVAKWAMTLDGKIATAAGDARWVSNERSRADVHALRHRLAAIMVGIGTVLADDPLLSARRAIASNQPLRVIVDSKLRIPSDCRLVNTANEALLLVATALDGSCEKAKCLAAKGIQVVSLPDAAGRVDLAALMSYLAQNGIDSVLVEGGGGLHESLFSMNLVNEAVVYVAPKVVGGAQAKTPVEGKGKASMSDAFMLGAPIVQRMADDVKLVYLADVTQRGGCVGANLGDIQENAGEVPCSQE